MDLPTTASQIHSLLPITPKSQILERLHILSTAFPTTSLATKTILEIGCGQGDMTMTLAHHLTTGNILAVDPAPLNYGSPLTLGQAQAKISETELGGRIQWIRSDPVEFLRDNEIVGLEVVVLAHSIWYLPSREYFRELLGAARERIVPGGKLLLAEWGMRGSSLEAEGHVCAVRALAAGKVEGGNVRCLMEPGEMREVAEGVGWRLEREGWIEGPDVDDGVWEVGNARAMGKREGGVGVEVEALLQEMERAVEKIEKVESMDVWVGVFGCGREEI